MRKLTLFSLVGVASIACLSVAVPATAEKPSYMDAETMVPAMGEPQTAEDKGLDEATLERLGDTDPASVRLVGEDDLAKYWVGREGDSTLCLFVETEDATSSSCGSLSDFYQSGLSLASGKSLNEPETMAEAYLLPADVSAEEVVVDNAQKQRFTASSDQSGHENAELLSVSPEGRKSMTGKKIERDSGVPFQFTPLSLEPRR